MQEIKPIVTWTYDYECTTIEIYAKFYFFLILELSRL